LCFPQTGAPRSGTGSRQGTAALAMLGMKDALTDTLVKQMRARFTVRIFSSTGARPITISEKKDKK
jgi:hypothetical protein